MSTTWQVIDGFPKTLDENCLSIGKVKLTLPVLRLLSAKAQECKDFRNPSKPCHVGTHWIALAEVSQMSTHLPGFKSFFRFFCILLFWT